MSTSASLSFLLAALRHHYGYIPVDDLRKSAETVDFEEVIQLATYHGLQLVLLKILKNLNLPQWAAHTQRLQKHAVGSSMHSLQLVSLQLSYLTYLADHGVRVLPYKGALFQQELYGTEQLRESADIDLLFHQEDVQKGVELLAAKGLELSLYNASFDSLPLVERIARAVQTPNMYEVLLKSGAVEVDCHWKLCYDHLPYQLRSNDFFRTASLQNFHGKQLLMPSHDTIFWMLVLHHGGKEQWLKLKYLLDLQQFLLKFGEHTNWAALLNQAKTYRLYRITLLGFYLLKNYLGSPLPAELETAVGKENFQTDAQIAAFWAQPGRWLHSAKDRWRLERLLVRHQDKGFSLTDYLSGYYKAYSYPNSPLEEPRLINFPERYHFLNFLSKVISYGVRKF